MAEHGDNLKNLSETARGWLVRILAAGSTGYGEFLKALAGYISPGEAHRTARRFARAKHLLLWVTIAYISVFLALNWLIGPWSLRAVDVVNDLLRGIVFAGSIFLARQKRVAIASQILLPLTAICFLPFHPTQAPDWSNQPAWFAAVLVSLFLIGWLLDFGAGRDLRQWLMLRALACAAAWFLFVVLVGVGWYWLTDGAFFPVFSVLASFAAPPWFALQELSRVTAPPIVAAESDEPFLYESAWRRWRFFLTGRLLAILLGAAPFLLFANQLDYQEELSRCAHVEESPRIVRWRDTEVAGGWRAFYWKDQGRFLTVDDLTGRDPEREEREHAIPAGIGWDETPASEPAIQASLETIIGHDPDMTLPSITMEKGLSELSDHGVFRAIYMVNPTTWIRKSTDEDLPVRFRSDDFGAPLPADVSATDVEDRIVQETGKHRSRDEVALLMRSLQPWRVDSIGRFVRRTPWPDTDSLYCLSYYPDAGNPNEGTLIGEKMNLHGAQSGPIAELARQGGTHEWLFFVIGVIGVIFVWRRGGDSVVARWVGVWLIGASVVPLVDSAENTLSRTAHWFWEESVLYHWNTSGSMLGPLFFIVYGGLFVCVIMWMAQLSPLFVWMHLCWPTRIHPRYSSVVRRLMVAGKYLVTLLLLTLIFVVCMFGLAFTGTQALAIVMAVYVSLTSVVMLAVGGILRIWTARASEIPRLGGWPIVAFILLNLSQILFFPTVFTEDAVPHALKSPFLAFAGEMVGWAFIIVLIYLILRKDFLRIRAVSGFAVLLLLVLLPFGVHWLEDALTPWLGNSPFFRQQGAEMVTLMLVVFLFPYLHEWLHEQLLAVSVPALRRIEHHLEHSLEKIVDAEDYHQRVEMVSDLLKDLGVTRYVLLSRRGHGRFAVDIDTLSGAENTVEVEVSEPLREYLGKWRHFIDLSSIGFEWRFFFHQFELYRLGHGPAVGAGPPARFVLPISVGESLRGILLLAEGPLESVMSTPAMSAQLNNLGLAAAMSRRAERHPR